MINNKEEIGQRVKSKKSWWKIVWLKSNLKDIIIIIMLLVSFFCLSKVNTYANESTYFSSNDYINYFDENQESNKIYKIFSLSQFDDEENTGLLNTTLSMHIDVVLPINNKEFLLIGGDKFYDASDGTRKGSIKRLLNYIYKFNIETNEIEKICKINGKRYINAEIIDNNVLLIGSECIEILNLQNKTMEQIFAIDDSYSELNYSHLLNSKLILFQKEVGTKLYIYDFIKKKMKWKNNFLEEKKYLYRDKLLLNDNIILFYNGVDWKNFPKPIDENYVYKIKNNKFEEDFNFGHIQHIARISDDKYLIIRSNKLGYKFIDDRRFYEYKYDKALLYNLRNKKIEKEYIIPFNTFQSTSIIPQFNSVKVNNKIFLFEDGNGLRYIFDVEKECFENLNKNFEFNKEFIQKTIKINEKQILIITDKNIYIYKD